MDMYHFITKTFTTIGVILVAVTTILFLVVLADRFNVGKVTDTEKEKPQKEGLWVPDATKPRGKAPSDFPDSLLSPESPDEAAKIIGEYAFTEGLNKEAFVHWVKRMRFVEDAYFKNNELHVTFEEMTILYSRNYNFWDEEE